MASGVFLTGIEFPAAIYNRPVPGQPVREEGLRAVLGWWLVEEFVPASRLLDSVTVTYGPLTGHQPIAIRSLALTGTALTSFTEDWYNRLHLLPKLLDYGAVGADTPKPVTLWNAHLSTTSLTDIDVINPTGIALSGPSVPRTLRPLEYVTHQIVALEDGPAEIASTLVYTTSRPDSLRVELVGQRANLWKFFPNWRETVTVESSFKTDILTSRSGREQRRALRGVPRKSLSYKLTADTNRMRAFNRAMAKWQNRPVVMGDPTRSAAVSMAAGEYQTTIYPMPAWLGEGISVVLDDRELLTVDSIGALGEITFRTPVTADARMLRPTLTGQMGQTLSGSQPTNGVLEVDITFDVTPGSEQPDTGSPGLYLLNGREVFTRRFNWANSLDVSYDWSVDSLDFSFGRTAITRPIDFGTVTRKAVFVQQGAADMVDLEQFYQRQKGQRGEFYMPSGLDDLPLMVTAPAGTVNLKTAGRDVFDAYNGDDVYRAVAVYFRDGRIVTRGLTGMYLDGGDTVLQLDRSFLTDVAPADVLRMSWLNCSRLASDQFTQEWLSSSVAQTSLAVSTLEDLAVENPVAEYDGAAQWVLEVWGERGIEALDGLDYLVNTAYPAVWFIPEAWVTWESTQVGLSGLDYVVNYRMGEIFSAE